MTGPGHRTRRARASARLRLAGAGLVAAAALALPGPVHAAFTASTESADNSIAAAGTFPTYPVSVAGDSPLFHHRSDDATAATATSAAADASPNGRPGTYDAPTDGPTAWWRFEEGGGATTVADSAGSVLRGTFSGGAAWNPRGHPGGAVTFGSDGAVTAPRRAVQTNGSYTVTAWLRREAATGDRIAVAQDGSRQSAFALGTAGDKWVVRVTSLDSDTASVTTVLSANVVQQPFDWTHLAAVHDAQADTLKLYVDGVLQGEQGYAAGWGSEGALVLGRLKAAGTLTQHWRGSVDDVRTFQRALTRDEIVRVHASPALHWAFDETSGTVALDTGRNSHLGSLVGTPSRVAGVRGQALAFNGTDQYVDGTRGAVPTDGSFSVSAWVNLPNADTRHQAVVSQAASTTSGFILKYEPATTDVPRPKWAFLLTRQDATNPALSVAFSTGTVRTNAWVHLVGVYDDGRNEVRVYVDGVLMGTHEHLDSHESAATGAVQVGRTRWNGAWVDHLAGSVDDARIYGHALSHADVGTLYRTPTMRWDLDEGSGSTVTDTTGGRNDGTLNGATWSTGHVGSAATFDGNDSVVARGPALRTDQSFTVSVWVRPTGLNVQRVVAQQPGVNTQGFVISHSDTNAWQFSMREYDSNDPTTPIQAVSSTAGYGAVAGRWTHLVAVHDAEADRMDLYVNGVRQGTGTSRTAAWSATGPFTLGKPMTDTAYWYGDIDRLATFTTALTGAQVLALHQETPRVHWDFEEGAGTTVEDRSGNGHTGTLHGSPAWTASTDGKPGRALVFSGDDHVSTGTGALDTTQSYTVAAWVNPSSLPTSGFRTVAAKAGTANSPFLLEYDGTAARWQLRLTGSDVLNPTLFVARASTAAQVNTWVHLAGVWDDGADRVRLYVNGALAADVAGPTGDTDWQGSGSLLTGAGWHNSAVVNHWQGAIDSVRPYQRSLGSDEIRQLAVGTRPAPLPSAPVHARMTAGLPGALQGPQQGQASSTAIAFDGTSNAYNATSFTNPGPFTVEAWFRTSSTTGGQIVGFADQQTGLLTTTRNDRHVYIDSGGRLTFGVHPGAAQTIRSDQRYDDGAWHHMAASVGGAGMRLYVDGALVASNAAITTAQDFTGWWRWGGGRLEGWPNRPATSHFAGTLDEMAVYGVQLTDIQVARHYHANF